ncbi:recombinase RecT [Gaetbulibacter sp. PBL-D1]|uniref:recombinase RecT n=1 Tax=Gaetbulibacter sp. PBL-D1 TaxID=3422594 RepID=UPI003D2F1729
MSKNELQVIKDQTLSSVQNRIAELQQGGFKLPANYSAENALQSAWLLLQDVKTRDNKLALEACSKNSIAMSLFKMVQMGLNPAKNQCYFIPYGDNLICMTSYFGQVLIAKRAGLKDVKANLILEKDDFNYKIEEDGRKVITEHKQPFENLGNKIIGAYCVVTLPDGVQDTDIMTIAEIKQAWQQGATKGNSPAHKNFEGEMAKRTVTNRAIKMFVNSSDDSAVLDDPAEQIAISNDEHVQKQIDENANKKEMSIDAEDVEVIDEEVVSGPKTDNKVAEQATMEMPDWNK